MLIAISSCVSLKNFDEWQTGNYETEKAELERFETMHSEYMHIVDFSSSSDRNVIIEESGSGEVSDGLYNFENNGKRKFVHYLINLEKLKEISSENIKRIAILIKPDNRNNGFVEIWPGDDLVEGNPNSVNNQGITSGSWSFLEFIVEGNTTKVKGSNFNKILPKKLTNLSVFCFNGSKVELDYILFD